MEIKSFNPKLKQSEIAKDLGCSSSTLQRYRQDKYMLSPYRIPSNTLERRQKILHREHDLIDLKWPQMTSIDLNWPQKE